MIGYIARWVVPVTHPPIEHGIVVVDGDRIAFVGCRADFSGSLAEEIVLGDVILAPGLVNAHCHLELTAMRGFLEDLDFRRWILRLTTAKRALLDRPMLLDAARAGVEEGILAGITTYADTCDSGVAIDAMIEYGVRGIMYQELFGPDPAQRDQSIADFRVKLAGLRAKETPLVRAGISPHAPYTVSDDLFRAAAELAAAESLPMAIHIAESDVETQLVAGGDGAFADGLRARGIAVATRGRSPVALLDGLGVLERRPLLIHCVRIDADDLAAVARHRAAIAHCPISNAKLGHGIAPLIEILVAGIDAGLGSDSVASNNRMDILAEARSALLFQRARLQTHEALSAADALHLATMGGACALGLGDDVGSLEAGKQADLAAFDPGVSGPVHDPVAALVHAAPLRAVFVAVAGNPLVVDGQPMRCEPGLPGRMQAAAERLQEWIAEGGELAPPPASGVR